MQVACRWATQSQVFIAIDYQKIVPADQAETILNNAVEDLLSSTPSRKGERIVYTGQKTDEIRKENLEKGIPVDEGIWAQIKELA